MFIFEFFYENLTAQQKRAKMIIDYTLHFHENIFIVSRALSLTYLVQSKENKHENR